MRIGFIGVGVMGTGMVGNLLKAGYAVSVYTRTREKAQSVLEQGALWKGNVAECVRDADAVITIVGYPADVEQVYFAPGGILESVRPGSVVVDMTTTSPQLSERIYREAALRGVAALDAPVSGGDAGARAGTLAIMAGGDASAFDAMLPVFQAMGKNIRHEGGAGMGQHTKMANQIAIAGALSGVCEAIRYAQAAGLDGQKLLDTISTGAAGSWQLSYNGPKMIAGDYTPGFYIKHFIKDMRLASAESAARGVPLPILKSVLEMFERLSAQGFDEEGTQALIREYL